MTTCTINQVNNNQKQCVLQPYFAPWDGVGLLGGDQHIVLVVLLVRERAALALVDALV